eukprot:TRINITY_DN1621_c0_g1_i2.p1 TRINITY_DN1621_c0_g1~~TRINITY_DN1621_c0_g1_i2.p1  ORF type:complete len:583 (+),score=132.56 TRINITY_DN1621_c0_g1_i2:66-1814(+)
MCIRDRLTSKDGSVYQGMFEKGKKNGFGTCYLENGDVYEGNWKNDMMSGWGTYKTKSGMRYEGQWLNDMKDGCMIVTSQSSIVWELQYWNNDQMLSSCSFTQNDPRLAHEEMWKDDIKYIGNGDISQPLREKIMADPRYVFSLLNSIDDQPAPNLDAYPESYDKIDPIRASADRSIETHTNDKDVHMSNSNSGSLASSSSSLSSPRVQLSSSQASSPRASSPRASSPRASTPPQENKSNIQSIGVFVKVSASDAFGRDPTAAAAEESTPMPVNSTTLKFPFGTYFGEVSAEGKLEGKGKMKFNDGSRYIGEWKDDQRHGEGVFHYVDGAKYTGSYRYNKKSGYGTQNFANGDIYQGDWASGAKDGWGMHRLNNGNKYEGQFKDDLKHGVGIGSNISANHRSLEVWERGILKAYKEYQSDEFPKITNVALRRAFEKGDVKELKLSIENNLFDITTFVTPLEKKSAYDKKGIALRKGYLTKQKGEQWQKRWVEVQNNGFLAYYKKKRSSNPEPSKSYPLEKYTVKVVIERGKFVFQLLNEADKQSSLLFQATSPIERDSWVALLQKVATNFNDSPEKPDRHNNL